MKRLVYVAFMLLLMGGCESNAGSSLDAISKEASPEQVYFEQLFNDYIRSTDQPDELDLQASGALANLSDIIGLHTKGRTYPDEVIAFFREQMPELGGRKFR